MRYYEFRENCHLRSVLENLMEINILNDYVKAGENVVTTEVLTHADIMLKQKMRTMVHLALGRERRR